MPIKLDKDEPAPLYPDVFDNRVEYKNFLFVMCRRVKESELHTSNFKHNLIRTGRGFNRIYWANVLENEFGRINKYTGTIVKSGVVSKSLADALNAQCISYLGLDKPTNNPPSTCATDTCEDRPMFSHPTMFDEFLHQVFMTIKHRHNFQNHFDKCAGTQYSTEFCTSYWEDVIKYSSSRLNTMGYPYDIRKKLYSHIEFYVKQELSIKVDFTKQPNTVGLIPQTSGYKRTARLDSDIKPDFKMGHRQQQLTDLTPPINFNVDTRGRLYPSNPTKENTLKITRPIMVGNINILEASENTLAHIIRQAQQEIKANEDLAEVSKAYQKKAEDLNKVIDLVVKQLDKIAK